MTNELCEHKLRVCSKCVIITDAAKRMTDIINLHITCVPWDTLAHSCMAFYLDDGLSDGVLYANRKDALSYQLRPTCVFYFRNAMGGVNAKDMQIWLNMQRMAYENDRIAWIDPDSPDLIISTQAADIMRGKR